MDKLSNKIRENSPFFDQEPNDGHLERFRQKLEQQPKVGNHSRRFSLLKIAAALIIVLLAANLATNISQPREEVSQAPASPIEEAAVYYNARINNGIVQLEQMSREGVGSPAELRQIKREMAEMDSLFQSLQQEFSANPNDERLINAMIDYYQTKLEIINTIKSDLESVKQQKMKYHENKSL